MTNSILDSTKKLLGIDAGYDVFDVDIKIHINTAFATLQQLGVGPKAGFSIESKDETWDLFTQNEVLKNTVKTYIYLRVRNLFDPPTTSFGIEAFSTQIKELEWRMNVQAETPFNVEVPVD